MTKRSLILILIAATATWRILLASVGGLGIDESYMVGNARLFALSYVDDPPLHIWLVGAWARLIGSEHALLLRLPFIALFAGSTWLMFRLTERLFGELAGLWAAVAFNLAPVFTIAHAMWILPDGPLLFFLLAAANVLARILFEPEPRHPTALWILAGAFAGLALLSKYHGAFVFVAVLIFLLTVPDQRRWLLTPGPWLGALAAALIFLPVVIWNLQNGLVGLVFQAGRLSTSTGLTLRWLPEVILGQMAYLTIWYFIPLAYLLGRALWRGPAESKSWFLALLAVGPVAFFTTVTLWERGLPHWEMPGWLFAFPLLGQWSISFAKRWPKLTHYGLACWGVIIAIVTGLGALQIVNGLPGRIAPVLFAQKDPTLDMLDWNELGPALSQLRLIDADTPALAAIRWLDAGKANYAVGRDVPVLCLCDGPQQFSYIHKLADFRGRNLILVGPRQVHDRLAAQASRFERWEPLPSVILHRHGEPAMALVLFRGVGFKG